MVGWFGSMCLVVVWVVAGLVTGIGGCGGVDGGCGCDGGFIVIQCEILLTCVYLTHHVKSVRWLFHY